MVGYGVRHLPEFLTIWVPLLLSAGHLISFALWTIWVSFTPSTLVPVSGWVGTRNYTAVMATRNWQIAFDNLLVFGCGFVLLSLLTGLLLAILLDQRIRGEGVLRPIYLYPMALSFIVVGTAWRWFLAPDLGLEKTMHEWGWTSFKFGWLVDNQMAIYTIVIAGVWQATGFCMAMFLAGLRGIDGEMIKAAQIDGASTVAIYRRIIIPQLRPVFLSAVIVLAHMTIKSYDLVVALTSGGPGNATELPSTFMYSYTFTRNQMSVGAASAVMMLMAICAIMVPYLYSELREKSS